MTNANYTHLALIVDRSGSMMQIASDMEGGIHSLLSDQANQPGELHVDIVTFDTQVETPYTDARADEIKGQLIVPRGSTALNDAVGSTIVRLGEKLAALAEDDRPGTVVVVVVTDGMENSSSEYTTAQVKEMVERQTSEFGWRFVYLAANVDAFATGGTYGFAQSGTMQYTANSGGVAGMTASASASILRSRMGQAADFTEEERRMANGE
jgi:uncharacterized protein YegL